MQFVVDLYVRFFRLAERRIAEKSSKGIVCFISNFSYLRDPSFVVMRKRFLSEFDKLWFDSLNGDSRETGKLTSDGKPDPSVFSTESNLEGIRVGTAIGLMVRKEAKNQDAVLAFRQFWGVTKRSDLLASLRNDDFNDSYQVFRPNKSNRLSFYPSDKEGAYLRWPSVEALAYAPPLPGFLEARQGALVDIDREPLVQRIQKFYDTEVDWSTLASLGTSLTKDFSDYKARLVRSKVQAIEKYDSTKLRHYSVRPFDNQWCYHSGVSPLWNRSRPELFAQSWTGNKFLVTRLKTEKQAKGSPLYFSSCLVDYQTIARNVSAIPIRLRENASKTNKSAQHTFLVQDSKNVTQANLSAGARVYLASLGFNDADANDETAGLIWMNALAIGYSPAYLEENADGLRGDWPRIPLPASKEALVHSAELGRRVAALLDTERGVAGVTEGKIEKPLDTIGIISRTNGGQLQTEEDEPKRKLSELRITAGWGHGGKGGITMPGKGKLIERDYTPAERKAIEDGAKRQGLSTDEMFAHLGERTCDVYLNEVAHWRNIPARVWDYTIGGYQVIKKWLSYREHKLLGRPLTTEEAREVMNITRRIASILLLEPSLDANYRAIMAATYPWPS